MAQSCTVGDYAYNQPAEEKALDIEEEFISLNRKGNADEDEAFNVDADNRVCSGWTDSNIDSESSLLCTLFHR